MPKSGENIITESDDGIFCCTLTPKGAVVLKAEDREICLAHSLAELLEVVNMLGIIALAYEEQNRRAQKHR